MNRHSFKAPRPWTDDAGDLTAAVDQSRSKAAFARQAGMHVSTLQNILRGENVPAFDKVAAMAAVTGLSLDWLAFGTGPQHRPGGTAENPRAKARQRADGPSPRAAAASRSSGVPMASHGHSGPAPAPGNPNLPLRYRLLLRLRGLIDRALRGVAD